MRAVKFRVSLGICLVAALAFANASAQPDYISLREMLEVERDVIRGSVETWIRSSAAQEFPKEKPGEAFQAYLKTALKAIGAEAEFPEIHRVMKDFKGELDMGDPVARHALGAFLGDYLTVRYEGDLIRELRHFIPHKTFNNIVEPNRENDEFHKAFQYLQTLATNLGLEAVNFDNETLAIQLPAEGSARDAAPVAMYTHIDEMRPVEYKWERSTPPFEMTSIEGGWIGLGIYSHKGPTLVNLFALRALRDANLKLSRPLVLLVSGSANKIDDSVESSLNKLSRKPALVLAADGTFPYATGEKGRVLARVSSDYGMKTLEGIEDETYYVYKAETTASTNTIPAETRIWVLYSDPGAGVTDNPASYMLSKWREVIEGYQKTKPETRFGTYVQDDTLHFFTYGRPGHVEADGRNSVMNAAAALMGLPFYRNSAWEILTFIDETFQSDRSGKKAGLYYEHPKMGGTDVNPVQFDRIGNEVSVIISIHFPPGRDAAWIRQWMKSKVDEYNERHAAELYLEWEYKGHDAIEMEPPAEVASWLVDAFELASADFEPPPAPVARSSGRLLPHAIPFGPEWPDSPKHGHTRHEKVTARELGDMGVAYVSALAWFAMSDAKPNP